MFDLFRFIMLRPPEKTDERDGILIAKETELHGQLLQARVGEEPLARMRQVAEGFVQGDQFVRSPDGIQHGASLNALHASLLDAAGARLAAIGTLIRNAFDQSAAELVANDTFRSGKRRVHDSLLAVKIAPPEDGANLEYLPLFARLINLVEQTALNDPALDGVEAIPRALVKPLILPPDLFPLPSPLERSKTQPSPAPSNSGDEAAATAKKLSAVEDAMSDLAGMSADDFVRPEQPPITPVRGSTETDRPGLFSRLFQLIPNPIATSVTATATSIRPTFTVRSESVAQLRTSTKSVLNDLRLDLTATPVTTAMSVLRGEAARLQKSFVEKNAAFMQDIRVANPLFFGQPVMPPAPPAPAIIPPLLPAVHGHIKPVGMADLLVVKYQLLRYERGEVAYIENILKGESSERSVRRLETTEETTVLETETTKEEERDLQSTERFELQNETENTVSAEGNLKSGSPFSPSYGPMLEFQGGTDSPISGSQTQASRQASNYSREVTSRSASKVTERVRKQVTLRKLREFEEKTLHTYNNSDAAAKNVTGVFQWVEKVLRGQVFNYGKRLMFDIMVPEPAALVQQAITAGTPAGLGINKPAPFTLGPEDINEWNYSGLAATYGAVGIEPPPQLWVTVSKQFTGRPPNPNTNAAVAVEQPLPDDYQATDGWIHHKLNIWAGDWHVEVTVGKAAVRAGGSPGEPNPNGWAVPLNNEVKSIPISMKTFHVEAYAITVEVNCVRTVRSMQAWRSRTHDAILRAYQSRLAEYEERIANLQASARIEALGRNPDENRRLIKEELKKSCISVFTYQHFDVFSAVELSPQGYVQIKLGAAEAQGSYIRFFEQAFEWEQMIYLFYPYFWGTKFFWMFKLRLEEIDPHFKDFLKAGEARVTVPVRPGFEKAVAHYLETGEIWNGSDPLDITSETYLPIMQEIQARDAVPGKEVPYGDPWEVRLPTTLVSLRDDGKLPSWKEEPAGSGHWVEA